MTKEEFRDEMRMFLEEFGENFMEEFEYANARINEFKEHDQEFGRLLGLLVQDFANLRAHVQSRMS